MRVLHLEDGVNLLGLFLLVSRVRRRPRMMARFLPCAM